MGNFKRIGKSPVKKVLLWNTSIGIQSELGRSEEFLEKITTTKQNRLEIKINYFSLERTQISCLQTTEFPVSHPYFAIVHPMAIVFDKLYYPQVQ